MQRIKAKLQGTSETMVSLVILVMNLQKLLEVQLLRQIKGLSFIYSAKTAGESSLELLKRIWSDRMSRKEENAEKGHFARYSMVA